nr:zinc finger C2H2 type [Hymenolepis microstoma]
MNGLRSYFCFVCNITCNSAEQLRMHESGSSHLKKCANSSPDTFTDRPMCYQPLQVSPVSESDSEDLQTCPMCCDQYSQAEFFTHTCERDLLASTSRLSGPFVVIDQAGPSIARKKRPLSEDCEFYCNLCDISLGSMANYDAHVIGKKHINNRKKLLNKKAEATFLRFDYFFKQIDKEKCTGLEALSCSLSDIKVVEGSDGSLVGSSLLHQSENAPSVYCNVCGVVLNSTAQMKSHVSGKKHRSKRIRTSGPVDVGGVKDSQNLSAQATPELSAPLLKPVVSAQLPPNSVMCHVCDVPVSSTELSLHEQGRAHIFKATMNTCAKINENILSENCTFKRSFAIALPSIISQLPPFPKTLQDHLFVVAEKIEDVVLKISFNDISSISAMALAIAMGIVSINRQDFEHNLAIWVCPQTSTVSNRVTEVRNLIQNFSVNKPLLANIQKNAFSLDNTELELTKHDIAFSTPGALTNLLISYPNIHRAVPALVLTDVESCVVNDPMHELLNRFIALPYRPRIIYLTSGNVPNWPLLSTFLVL